jgi:Putative adhesin
MSVTAPTPPPPPPPPTTLASPPVQPPQSSRSGSRLALQIGAIITGVLIIVAALNLFSLTAGRSSSDIHRSFEFSGRSLMITAGSADVTLVPGAASGIEVERTARVPHGQTMKEPSISGDVLSLPANCHSGAFGWLWFCSVHYTVRVPADLQLDVHADSGDLEATSISTAALALKTGSGDVTIRRVDATDLTAETGSGDVDGSHLGGGSIAVKTGSGDVGLDFDQDPTTVQAHTGSGDLSIAVPRDDATYYIQANTGSGDYSNRVRSIGEAPAAGTQARSINAETGSGDLTIRYAG